MWDRSGGLPTLISTSGGDNYVHTAGISRDGDGWLLADAVGSVRTIVDNTGATTGSQSFTAFGEQLTGSGTFGFAGERQDPTGLQHLRARQYNPSLGRFTTVDPIQPGAPGTTGYNLYAYAGNNPTTWTDPSGQVALTSEAGIQRGVSQPGAVALSESAIVAEAAAGTAAIEAYLAAQAVGSATAGGLGAGKIFGFLAFVLGGGLILGGDTPTPEPEPPVVNPPVVFEPVAEGEELAPAPEAQREPSADGDGARDGGGPCDVISVDDALQRISDFLGGDGRLVVSGSGNYQWIVTEQVGASTVTRIGRLDINPNSPHVVKFGPHLNLETQIDGKSQRSGTLADPHTEVDASTVREGDYPSC